MEEPLKEPTVIEAPPGAVLVLLLGLWAVWGALIFWLADHGLGAGLGIRLIGALVVGFILALFSTCIFLIGYTKWQRSMTPEERAKWEKENAERAAEILAAREAQERKRREALARQEELKRAREQARSDSITTLKNFLSSLEKDPQAAKLLARLHAGPVDQGTVDQALAHPDIVLAGIRSWLERKGRHNNLPDVGFPESLGKGRVEGPLDDLFGQLRSKERDAFLDILTQGAELAEEALAQGVSQHEIIEMLLPLILS